jgi:hypothetical protein
VAEISRRSVLAVLGVGALAAGAQYAVDAATAAPSAADGPTAPGPDNPVRAENRRPGSRGWRIGAGGTVAADDLNRRIKGYASADSVDVGGMISFHVSTHPARPFTVTLYRMGHYAGLGARQVAQSRTLPGVTQPEPVTDPATGLISCGWSPSWTVQVPREWTSGAYLAAFTTEDGHRSFTPFVVRDDARTADFLIVLPFATYQAYNQWPLDGRVGKSLYYGYGRGTNSGGGAEAAAARTDVHGAPIDYGTRARVVGFDRPYSGVGLPQRADLDYAALQWAERSGYDLCYATSADLHAGRIDPARYAALVFSGHDEYWSLPMRDAATAAVDSGTHLAYLAANNVYWHVRFVPGPDGAADRAMVCWKTDPDPQPDASGPTRMWRQLGRHGVQAEQQLIGVQYNGIPKTDVPLVIQNAQHWLWDGTGVREGEQIPGIVGGEADGHDPGAPSPADVTHTLLSASPYQALDGGTRTRTQHTSLYETQRGAIVFAAATFNWTLGLNRPGYADPRIQRATANLFNRLRQRPAG